MSQTKKADRVEAQNIAIKNVTEFFTKNCPYQELLEIALGAQTDIMHIQSLLTDEQREEVKMEDLTDFVYFAIKLAMAAKYLDKRVEL